MTSTCECCGRDYSAKRATSRFCSDVCRMRAKRGGSAPKLRAVTDLPKRHHAGSLLGSVMIALEEAKALETPAGRLAVSLATRIDDPESNDSGSAVASLSRELRAVLGEALARSSKSASPLDEIRAGLRVV